jgi:hypothetical protein
MRRFQLCLWASCLILIGCASSPTPAPTAKVTPARLYPLSSGSAWSYDVDTGDGSQVLATMRVTESDAGRAAVQGGEGVTHYELRADGIYRPDRGGYLLKAPLRAGATWLSGDGVQAEISASDIKIETAAGSFSGCLEVVERGSASGAVITTTYCPDVGPVQIVSSLQLTTGTVRVVARLRGYQVAGSGLLPNNDSPRAQ